MVRYKYITIVAKNIQFSSQVTWFETLVEFGKLSLFRSLVEIVVFGHMEVLTLLSTVSSCSVIECY